MSAADEHPNRAGWKLMPYSKPDAEQLVRLLQAVAGGDERAFGELYRISSGNLYGVLLRMLRKPEWADEALQDCYLKIWHRSESYEPEKGPPLAWLTSIARYRAIDLLRSRRVDPKLEVEWEEAENITSLMDVAASQPPPSTIGGEDFSDRLADSLQELHEDERRYLMLVYYEGYTHLELSQMLKVPLGTVKSRVRRGLARMRKFLQR